ncbi:MAG: hypothetical protein JSV32_02230 [Dehalococcoidia bacterium]|nr:MAG: hypothetical protein JSV32_02230 [Dehalococcoidia bacterium]
MNIFKTMKYQAVITLILSLIAVIASCASEVETTMNESQENNTTETATTAPETTTFTTRTTTTTTATTSVTPTATITTPTTPATVDEAYIPTVGVEFPAFSWRQDKWTILQLNYEGFQEATSEWHFPWSFTIRNETETALELTAYILYVGFHNWIGHVSETPFVLNANETMVLSGEDILSDALVTEMAYVEEVNVDIYVAES